MYYLWHARELPATADGRRAGEMLSANFSPSLQLKDAGPLSVISAMARPNISRVCNGGPLTLEVHDTVMRNQEGLRKTAQLVRSYIQLGGHQLQLNAVNRESLLEAQRNPEAYGNLIVRVWGWSGHFVQLDKEYQDQIIERTSYRF
jgi:formate C-acetyltransferase